MRHIIKKIIDDWDPIDIFPYAPENEYDYEINRISEELDILSFSSNLKAELAKAIYRICRESFGEGVIKCNYEKCMIIAEEILNNISG